MSLYHHLKTWLGKKREHSHEEETVAVPEIHTGKVAHHTDADALRRQISRSTMITWLSRKCISTRGANNPDC